MYMNVIYNGDFKPPGSGKAEFDVFVVGSVEGKSWYTIHFDHLLSYCLHFHNRHELL